MRWAKLALAAVCGLVVIFNVFGAAANDAATAATAATPAGNGKILIAYYSYSGNTATLAREIQKQAGGDLFVITPVNPYPSNYRECLTQAKLEIDGGVKPELRANVANLAQYDTIFVGTPNWYGGVTPPVTAFLAANDLTGKKVIPFCTHGTGGEQNCLTGIAALTPNSDHAVGLAVAGNRVKGASVAVAEWLQKIR
ncbi:flavodoxin [Planctomycetales bacterium]|nr:flavodoxin [Planctomycetales bacterium]